MKFRQKDYKDYKDYKELEERLERIEKNGIELQETLSKEIRDESRETKRRLSAVCKAIERDASVVKNEQELLKMVSDLMPYVSVNINASNCGKDFKFIFNSKEPFMAKHMWGFNKGVHSEGELKTFLELSEKYYGVTPNGEGTFFDIGGNIGTTSVYMAKCFKNLNVVAFEPDKENCKTFRINAIMNDCDIELYCMALGDKEQTATLALSSDNMGDHRILNSSVGERNVKKVVMNNFDNWNEQHKKKIKYVWMDVQGYEGFVLEGMKDTLEKNIFPIWMEFCPSMLRDSGSFEKLTDILEKYFVSYIDRHDINTIHDIGDIYNLSEELQGEKATDLFLIRKR